MLRFLQIRDYAIVDSLDLELGQGFTCITGETGAGKSMLVDALALLSGQRADTSAIRGGAARAELSAEFVLEPDSAAMAWLRAADLDDGESCLLRRLISAEGRSRAWINGTLVTLQQLGELGELLIEIHGQNEHIRLVRSDEQFALLDGAGEYEAERRAVSASYERWRALDAERQDLLREQPLAPGDAELLAFQLQELEQDLLPADRFAELEAEHRMLARGSEILASLEDAVTALDSHTAGAGPALHRTAARLERHASLDADIAAASSMLREAAINCDEALVSLQAALSRLDLSPQRLERVERELHRQHDLARKHRVQPERLAEVLARLKERLERANTLDRRLAEIDAEIAAALSSYRDASGVLHGRRLQRAGELSTAVTELIRELGMPGGVFEFSTHYDPQSPPSARGDDRLEMRVSANAGVAPALLRKVASGGELSRISLAIRVAARTATAATQVFDEVDAGIGGETATAVGALLRGLATGTQALCVTHLAQVAVFADQQLQVIKTAESDQTQVQTSLLAEPERIDEIARMLGGRLSEQSRAHAAELLATASTRH